MPEPPSLLLGDLVPDRARGRDTAARDTDLEAVAARLSEELAGATVACHDGRLVATPVPGSDPVDLALAALLVEDLPRLAWTIVEDVPLAVAVRLRPRSRERLAVRTGEPGADRLLDALAPLLGDLVGDLTARQRSVARLLVVEGLRQADAAERLGVSRATVSVMVARGRIAAIASLAGAVKAIVAAARLAISSGEAG